jgi:hypothetical protein
LDWDEALWGDMWWGVCGLYKEVRRKTWDVWASAFTESNQIGVRRVSRDDGKKREHLRNNAATAASSCINWSGWGGLGLGGVGGDGEELSEEIHWCDCVVWFDRCDETVLMLRGLFMLSFYTLRV